MSMSNAEYCEQERRRKSRAKSKASQQYLIAERLETNAAVQCHACKQWKSANQFSRCDLWRLRPLCKACGVQKTAEYRKRNPGAKSAESRRRRERLGQAAKHQAHVAEWKRVNATRTSRISRIRLHCAHVTAWRKARSAHAWRIAYRTNDDFNAREKVRARLRKLTADAALYKYFSSDVRRSRFRSCWSAFLGYDLAELVIHLRRVLPKRASWQQFLDGHLHIDHILPRSSFDLSKPEEVRACWSLSNLRLLDAKSNIAKGAKRETLL